MKNSQPVEALSIQFSFHCSLRPFCQTSLTGEISFMKRDDGSRAIVIYQGPLGQNRCFGAFWCFGGPLGPLGPLGFNSPNIAQRHALHVERTAEKAFMLSDRV